MQLELVRNATMSGEDKQIFSNLTRSTGLGQAQGDAPRIRKKPRPGTKPDFVWQKVRERVKVVLVQDGDTSHCYIEVIKDLQNSMHVRQLPWVFL